MKRSIPNWNSLTEKKRRELLRRGFIHAVERVRELVETKKQDLIEVEDLWNSAYSELRRYLDSRMKIPNKCGIALMGEEDVTKPDGQPSPDSRRIRKGSFLRIKLTTVAYGLTKGNTAACSTKDEVKPRKYQCVYDFQVERQQGRKIWARYLSAEAARLVIDGKRTSVAHAIVVS